MTSAMPSITSRSQSVQPNLPQPASWTVGSVSFMILANCRAFSTYPHFDLVCFSHLPWDLVFQRPQHLLTRAARERRVFYVQEPEWGGETVRYAIAVRESGVWVVQ